MRISAILFATFGFAVTALISAPVNANNKVCYVFPGMMSTPDPRSAVEAVSKDIQNKGCKAGDSLVFRHGAADEIVHMVAASKCDLSKSVLLTSGGGSTILSCSIAP